jgi:hypothetical protein
MPKSNSRNLFGRGSSTVTVIEDRVRRSSARNAKIAFWVIGVITALLTATIAASYTHPIIAAILGIAIGAALGFIVGGTIFIWPVLRVLWWWTPELLTAAGLLAGWVDLAQHTSLFPRLAITAVIIGVPALIPWLRTRIIAFAWCFITRHRLRVCFNEFIITNRTGSLPLMLWARPTPVGERVWIWLRPGLSLEDLQTRLDRIAPACWADRVTVERASDSNAAYLCIDIKRRHALADTIGSPLVDMIDTTTTETETDTITPGTGTALDLTDVPETDVTEPVAKPRHDTKPKPRHTPAPEPASVTAGSDYSDWI